MSQQVLDGYARSAPELFERYDALDAREVNAPILHLIPTSPARILDIGAGTGRDAAWLAEQGHDVVAVEPIDTLREGGRIRHPDPRIEWLADRLPALETLAAAPDQFDLIKLTGVWAHLEPAEQLQALTTLTPLLVPGGRLAFSIKRGYAPADRPVHDVPTEVIIAAGRDHGLNLILNLDAPSIQPANQQQGVTWTWLAFEAPLRN